MNEETWTRVDEFLAGALIAPDAVQAETLTRNAAEGLPAIDVSPVQGKLLHLLARIRGAKRILEVGTLGGYSTIWLARALPADGRLLTLEFSAKHAGVARKNVERAGLSGLVEIRVGAALDSLAAMERQGEEAFDLIFIDADKPNNPEYLKWALRFSKVGTVIVGDNVIRDGRVADPADEDERVVGSRRLVEMMGQEPRIDATALQTVGIKGYDGFALGLVVT
jgi:predicted O-methyltransferase YrrM